MVHVSTPRPSLGASLGNAIGGIGGNIAGREYNAYKMEQGLNELKNLSPNATPTDTLAALMKASVHNKEIGRNLGPLYQAFQGEQNRRRATEVPLTGGGIGAQGRDISQNIPQQPQQINQGGIGAQGRQLTNEQSEKFFPSNKGQNEAPGNAPQQATGGLVRPIKSETEVLEDSEKLYSQWVKSGITDRGFPDAYNIKHNENEGNKSYNQNIEAERQNRIQEQQRYGALAEEALNTVLPEATDEQKAFFAKKGEEQSTEGKSEADTKRFLAKEATKFKNTISNIQNALSAPRIQNKLQNKFSGTEKTLDQAMEDASLKVQPLVKEGLIDTSRTLLADAGFYPEERETIIHGPLDKSIKKEIKNIDKPVYNQKPAKAQKVPGMPFPGVSGEIKEYTPQSYENLKNNIETVWGPGENKKINMLQMRKEYEDLGYDWRILKDSLNDLLKEGKITLTDDQFNQFDSYMDEPPMTYLEKILHKLNIIGR